MDRLISRGQVQQCSQMLPGVHMREKCCSHCYPVSLFHILILLLLLPTLLLCELLALDTGHLRVQVIQEDTQKYLNL